jgi:AmmeMemoRadiSam system protein B
VREGEILLPAVAGSWYPAAKDALAAEVDRLLDQAAERVSGREAAGAIVVPHAGFAYSGEVAAAGFTTIRSRAIDRVVLVGPSHHFGFRGAAVPDRARALRTPLGDVPVDREPVDALREAGARGDDRVFVPEHALEAELPFLQRLVPAGVPVVPVLLGGRASVDDATRLAETVSSLMTSATLVVVSSDFVHFGERFGFAPFQENVAAGIRALDMGAVAAIESGDAAGFARHVASAAPTICGHRAIDVLLRIPRIASGATLVAYDTSGRITGRWDHSVSYAAIAAPGARAA